MSASFASDNMSGFHPAVATKIIACNVGYDHAYGNDATSKEARDTILKVLNAAPGTVIGYTPTGTGGNVLALKYAARKYAGMSVIAAKQSHINTDECASPEIVGGIKVLTVPTADGKINVETHKVHLDQYLADVRVERISTTELGTVYSLDELKKLREFATKHNLLIHMDGARLSNAAVSLRVPISDITQYVDILTFGLTKNGAMGCEIIVFLNKDVCGDAYDFKAFMKSHMCVVAKNRFIAAQAVAMLEGDLYVRNAQNANAMCALLLKRLVEEQVVSPDMVAYSPDANALILRLRNEIISALRTEFTFYTWSAGEVESEVRLMTSWCTTEQDVQVFVQHAIAVLRPPVAPSLPPSSLSLQPTTTTTTTTTSTLTPPSPTTRTTTPLAPTLRLQA